MQSYCEAKQISQILLLYIPPHKYAHIRSALSILHLPGYSLCIRRLWTGWSEGQMSQKCCKRKGMYKINCTLNFWILREWYACIILCNIETLSRVGLLCKFSNQIITALFHQRQHLIMKLWQCIIINMHHYYCWLHYAYVTGANLYSYWYHTDSYEREREREREREYESWSVWCHIMSPVTMIIV